MKMEGKKCYHREQREILFEIFLRSLNYSELVKLWKSVQYRKQK